MLPSLRSAAALTLGLLLYSCAQQPAPETAQVKAQALTSCASIPINENAYYRIVGRQSGKVLDVSGVSFNNGAALNQWGYVGGDNQKWRFQSSGNGFYRITAKHSGKAMDVSGVSQNNGAIIHQWDYVGGDNQQWCLQPTDSGFYRILAKHSGKAVDVKDLSTADGGVIHQWDYLGGQNQQWKFEQVETISSGSNFVYSVAASSIPAPTGSGVMTFKVLNGTNGAYADSNIYWGVLGINPANGRWSYLDRNGVLQPISTALNDAPNRLVKNGVNYANIYTRISEANWVSLPRITSGRMFLCVGSPCYIKTFDNGFAGPDINNPTDPNRNIYFDFIEFTVDATGYHGNTTRVDGFGFPIQHRLVNRAGNFDRTVGELESETRAGIFSKYQNEVPAEFKHLGTLQAPYRIVAPIFGDFKAGGSQANYFASYVNQYWTTTPTKPNTQEIFLCNGNAADAAACAAVNRRIYHNRAAWNTPSQYYLSGPANYYAKFWHDHSIDRLAYGFAYDDVNQQAAYLEVGDPKGLIVRVGW